MGASASSTHNDSRSLAFAITGTKWNGHRFFGVRHRHGVRVRKRKDDAKGIDGRERPSALARGKPTNRPLEARSSSSSSASATTDAVESVP